MQSKRRRSKDLFKQFIKPFKEIDVDGIAEKTKVYEFSKKLGLKEHLLIMLWYVIGDCITLTELSDSLKGVLPERYNLIEISKSQLSKVNKSRDYRAFVWAFYELIDRIWRDRRHWKIKQDLKVLGIDSTFLIWKSKYSEFGYCGLTREIEEGIKIHTSALLEPLTIPLTVMVTPGNVHDSLEFDNLLEDSKVFIDLHEVILVFDKGYWKLDRFKELEKKGYRFVTPMKTDTKYDLKIERFIGKNLNAVLIQIFSTLMAYLLIALLKTLYKMSILKVRRRLKYGIDHCYRSGKPVYSFSDV